MDNSLKPGALTLAIKAVRRTVGDDGELSKWTLISPREHTMPTTTALARIARYEVARRWREREHAQAGAVLECIEEVALAFRLALHDAVNMAVERDTFIGERMLTANVFGAPDLGAE